ncbi:MAG: hypothetical protein HY602_02530 [Parcubacteria group bacterium]|nr:hypothetical protein [Parcubacteria group bacterium]
MFLSSNKQPQPHRCPFWLVDAKWIIGLTLLPLLNILILTIVLYALTTKDKAVEISSLVIASSFSPKGLDSAAEMDALRTQLKRNPKQPLFPFPNLPMVTISLADTENRTPRQIRLFMARQAGEPLYEGGVSAVTDKIKDADAKKSVSILLLPLSLFTAKVNQGIFTGIIWMSVIASILYLLSILIAYRLGRWTSAGWTLINASFPTWLLLQFVAQKPAMVPPLPSAPAADQNPYLTILSQIIQEPRPIILAAADSIYGIFFFTGAALLIAALIGKFVYWLLRRKQKST